MTIIQPNVLVANDPEKLYIEVYTPSMIVELRNYEYIQKNGDSRFYWKDENGKACHRMFYTSHEKQTLPEKIADNLQRIAEDVNRFTSTKALLTRDDSPDGLHVLTIDGTDFYFHADNGLYDGWGKAIQ